MRSQRAGQQNDSRQNGGCTKVSKKGPVSAVERGRLPLRGGPAISADALWQMLERYSEESDSSDYRSSTGCADESDGNDFLQSAIGW
jgi:hypothetical protein